MNESKATILVIDDEPKICKILSDILSFKGFHVLEVHNGEDALKIIPKNNIDVVLLDLMLPGISGMEVLKEITTTLPNIPVILISAFGTVKVAVEAIKKGAYDFIEKPLDADRILITVNNAIEKRNLTLKTKRLQHDILNRYKMVGKSSAIHNVFRQIEILAPTNAKILITGESGTGKELVAQAIHNLSIRVGYPIIKINCAAIPDSLLESELFGYEKGAFTGALNVKKGRVELANKGTLFLDEIGDIKFELQAKLLRLIEEQQFERLGSVKTISVDFRLIAATNKDLKTEVKNGCFREDLYYRLNSSEIQISPLRKRKEDIPSLAYHFLEKFCEDNNLAPKKISEKILSFLSTKDWPGNVREFKHYIENLATFEFDQDLIEKLPDQTAAFKKYNILESQPLKRAKQNFEKDYIQKILDSMDWNITQAAEYLEIERTHLHKKIKILNIINPNIQK